MADDSDKTETYKIQSPATTAILHLTKDERLYWAVMPKEDYDRIMAAHEAIALEEAKNDKK